MKDHLQTYAANLLEFIETGEGKNMSYVDKYSIQNEINSVRRYLLGIGRKKDVLVKSFGDTVGGKAIIRQFN